MNEIITFDLPLTYTFLVVTAMVDQDADQFQHVEDEAAFGLAVVLDFVGRVNHFFTAFKTSGSCLQPMESQVAEEELHTLKQA